MSAICDLHVHASRDAHKDDHSFIYGKWAYASRLIHFIILPLKVYLSSAFLITRTPLHIVAAFGELANVPAPAAHVQGGGLANSPMLDKHAA